MQEYFYYVKRQTEMNRRIQKLKKMTTTFTMSSDFITFFFMIIKSLLKIFNVKSFVFRRWIEKCL